MILDMCSDLTPIIYVIKMVLKIIMYGIPMLLILFITIDLGKAIISSDDKEVKAAQSRAIKRAIYTVAIFFVGLFVTILMNTIAGGLAKGENTGADTTSWATCWQNAD